MKVKLFGFLLIFLFACSSVSDKDLYESGLQKIKDNNYIGAVTDFQKVINDFPGGEYEVKATYELAKLYHGQAIKTLTKEESLSKAVELYKSVFEKIPDTVEGEKALFMAAFLEANELKKFDDARESYNKFLEKYPNSSLAASAKEEIENLGIPPEEILKKKANTTE